MKVILLCGQLLCPMNAAEIAETGPMTPPLPLVIEDQIINTAFYVFSGGVVTIAVGMAYLHSRK